VLRCDIYRYFPTVDHEILKRGLRRRITCPRTLALADRIIDASNPQEPVRLYYPGDGLFTPWERRRGLPIGNLTSQFFANVYLDGLDHFCKEPGRPPDPACCAAVPGTTNRGISGPPTATGTPPGTGTTTTVSVLPARSVAGAGVPTGSPGAPVSVQGRP